MDFSHDLQINLGHTEKPVNEIIIVIQYFYNTGNSFIFGNLESWFWVNVKVKFKEVKAIILNGFVQYIMSNETFVKSGMIKSKQFDCDSFLFSINYFFE